MNENAQTLLPRPASATGLTLKAVLLAAGRGTRMRETVGDKVLAPVEGHSSFFRSVDAFRKSNLFSGLIVVFRDREQRELLEQELPPESPPVIWTAGGERRQDSVFNGLAEAGLETDFVFIHDCARPLVRPSDIQQLWEIALKDGAATLAHPVTDTIKKVHKRKRDYRRCSLRDLDRRTLWAMETPQAFDYEKIFDAYQMARQSSASHTDDVAVASSAGMKISLVESSAPNPKITRPADLRLAAFLIQTEDT